MQEFKQDFLQADTDNDGYLNRDQFHQFFKKYDPDFYIGFATSVLDKFNYDLTKPNKISLPQALEFWSIYKNNILYLFDLKYEFLREYEKMRVNPAMQISGGAPSAEFDNMVGKPQDVRLRLKVGEIPEVANHIEINLKKSETNTEESFAKLVIRALSPDKADLLVVSINNFHKNLCETLLGELPEASYILNRLQVDVKRVDSNVELTVRSDCPELNQIISIWLSFADAMSDSPTVLDLSLKIASGVSFKDFSINQEQNFYSLISRNFNVQLDIKTNKQVMQTLKKIAACTGIEDAIGFLKNGDLFKETMLFLYMCCTEQLDANLEFENTPTIAVSEVEQEKQKEYKFDLLKAGPMQVYQVIREQYAFGEHLMEDIYNNAEPCIEGTVTFGKVWVNAKLSIPQLGYLYKEATKMTVPETDD